MANKIAPGMEAIEKIESAYSQFRAAINPIIEEFGYELLTYGYRHEPYGIRARISRKG